ncbi:MAG TPA: aminotransferase class III-fold pyridoxal phosphate-dependent enzyme [Bauldia sp.]|nr:aminotransferase class III-fold pyridoxal phosphate-dependent enzyme [Bauldia sp.]
MGISDGTNIDRMRKQAFEHCIFPLARIEDVHRDGPNIYVEGRGVELVDQEGRIYLDMMSSHTRANSLGYGNDEIARAVYEQLGRLHYVGTYDNFVAPAVALAAKIAELAPGRLSRVMYVSGGSEAVEAALKLAKQYQVVSGRKPRAYKIIARWNAYHGATMGAISVTDWLGTRHISEPGVPGTTLIPGPTRYRNPFGMPDDEYEAFCADYLEQQILHEGPDLVAAFIAEPVMQANGVQPPSAGYFKRIREICDKYGVLLIIDEVITGFGRTGAWFASEHYGIEPDIMTMAKAMTAGYFPMGAMIARKELVEALPVFRHVHTFSGHGGGVAAAAANIAICERDGIIAKARDDGAYFLSALKDALAREPIVGDVRGIGMWVAVDFTADRKTRAAFADDTVKAVVRHMRDAGVLASGIGISALEMAPPLICGREHLDRAVEALAQAVRSVTKERRLA